jgi:SAM-dependent methyltransferase
MEWWETFFDENFTRLGLEPIEPSRTRKETDFIIDALHLDPGSKVLDLGCGVGRHSLELARRGFKHVTGLDFSKPSLERAMGQAGREGLPVRFIEGDMRSIPFEGELDAVLSFFTSFGYFDDPKDDERTIGAVARALKKGGRFLLEVANRDYIVRHFEPRGWTEHHGEFVLEDRTLDLSTSINHGEWVFVTKQGPVKREVRVRLYSLHELIVLLGRNGLRFKEAWGTLDKQPLTFDHSRLKVLAVKE